MVATKNIVTIQNPMEMKMQIVQIHLKRDVFLFYRKDLATLKRESIFL